MDDMELTRYLTGQGRSGREIYFAINCILLLNNISDVYILNPTVGIIIILISPESIYPPSHPCLWPEFCRSCSGKGLWEMG